VKKKLLGKPWIRKRNGKAYKQNTVGSEKLDDRRMEEDCHSQTDHPDRNTTRY
jgi:hypothetical protein